MKVERKEQTVGNRGSLTVEASLLLPILCSIILFFLYFFQLILIREQMEHGLWQTAQEISRYGYIYEQWQKDSGSGAKTTGKDTKKSAEADTEKSAISSSETVKKTSVSLKKEQPALSKSSKNENTAKNQTPQSSGNGEASQLAQKYVGGWLTGQRMKSYVSSDFLDHTCIVGGANGIVYTTEAFAEGAEITLCASYSCKMPLFSFVLPNIQMVHQVHTRAFVGTTEIGPGENGDEDDIIVYLTPTGRKNKIYHTSMQCSAINLTIQTTTCGKVPKMRNVYGKKYYACDKCVKSSKLGKSQTVYVTTDGDCYHSSMDCSGLTRNVTEAKLSTLIGYRACSKCGNK